MQAPPSLRRAPRALGLDTLATTGNPPPLPARWVPRARLHARLSAASHHPLTVVNGAPGCGKTTLVAGWLRSGWPGEAAWISLGGQHGVGAVSRAIPHLGAATLLVIDDIESLSDRSEAERLEEMIGDAPPDLAIVLVGRHSGALSISKLGLATDITEVSGKELAFTDDEAAALLSAVSGRAVDDRTVEEVVRWTGGWAAGLRLAGLTLADRIDPGGTADELGAVGGPVWDYMEREVMDRLPAEDTDFLERTSVIDPVIPELCEALTGRSDASRVLESLALGQFFVDYDHDGVYLYHPLLRDHLGRRLARRGQDAVFGGHLRAADWLAHRGDLDGAARHYVLANRPNRALDLGVAQVVRHLTTGLLPHKELPLPGPIPEAYFAANPLRMYPLCASLLCSSRLDEAAQWLGRFESSLIPTVGSLRQRARAEFLWAIYDSAVLDGEGVINHFERATTYLERDQPGGKAVGGPQWLRALDDAVMAVIPWIVAKAHAEDGHSDTARWILDQHRHQALPSAGSLALGSWASVAVAGGQLGEAVTLARRALYSADGSFASTPLRVESHVALATALFERDEMDAARDQLAGARKLAQDSDLERWIAVIDTMSARLSLSEGNPGRALHQLQVILGRASSSHAPNSLLLRISHLELRCLLALGEVEWAHSIFEHTPPAARRPHTLARIYLGAGKPDKAAAELARQSGGPVGKRDEIERALLVARVNLQLGNPRTAEHALQQAVDIARPERFLRVFMEEPRQTAELLRTLGTRAGDPFLAELISRCAGPAARQAPASVTMLEPLTERERELVAFLPSHLTQYEIGRQMYISANTVKTHMKGLYRKLGASSRSEAVELARSCGLL